MISTRNPRLWMLLGSGLLAVAAPLLVLWPDQEQIPVADWPQPTGLSLGAPTSSGPSARQLFVAGQATADPAAQAAPAPKLLGIALRIRGKGVAVVRLASGETQNLYVGDVADGWKLTGLSRKEATFTGTSGPVTVALDFSNKETPVGAPSQGATAPQPQRTEN
jgi:hypothetical protein